MAGLSLSSLRSRLLLLVLLALVPALGLMLYTASEQRRLAAVAVQDSALRLARLASLDQERLIDATRQLLGTLAQIPEVRGGDPRTCSTLLGDVLTQSPRYSNLGVAGLDGAIVCSAVPLTGSVNVADRTYFRNALQTGAFAVGEYQIGRITGKATLNFGYPIRNERGRVQAVVFAALDLDWLNHLAAEARLPPGSTLTVIDRNGTVLVHYPEPERWVGQEARETPFVRTMLAQSREGTLEAPGLDDVPRFFAFTPLGTGPGASGVYVSIGIPTAAVEAESNRLLGQQLAGLALVGVLTLAAAWVGSDLFVVRQVRALVRATRRLSAGDLSARTGLRGGRGELHQLAHAFDDMAESLQRHQAQRLVAEQQRAELARAAQVQAELLPRDVPALPGFELAARCVPAREVGGDFYDWQELAPGLVTLTLGDVMGKGMAAALLMATVRAALRAIARQGVLAANNPTTAVREPDLAQSRSFVTLFHAQLVQAAAVALEPDLTRAGSFATLFQAQLTVADRRLAYVDAGHGCVFLRRADGRVEALRPRGLPLGVLAEATYQEGSVTLWPGDALVVYSDGLLDARPELGLTHVLLADQLAGAASAQAMVDRLVALPGLSGPPSDDLTVLVLRCREEA